MVNFSTGALQASVLALGLAQVRATPALNHALVRDILPDESPKCRNTGQTTFNFDFSKVDTEKSNWNPLHKDQEEKVFMVEMSNGIDPEKNALGWRLRIGQAGVIYSFIGKFGEALPPQGGAHSPWNDEVWQQTMTNRRKNNPDAGGLYMIHQAGVYLYDDELKGIYPSPYAMGDTRTSDPEVAISCEGNSCAAVSWGQHAHIPTPHPSNALYYTRVADCGYGILEYTYVTHNMKVEPNKVSDYFDLFTTPWVGLRGETFRDVFTTFEQEDKAVLMKPRPIFQENGRPPLDETLGYTIFTEGISDDEVLPPFVNPCVHSTNIRKEVECVGDSPDNQLDFVMHKDNPCALSHAHMAIYGKPVIRCFLKKTKTAVFGKLYSDILVFNEKDPDTTLHIRGILQWAARGQFLFFIGEDTSYLSFMNRNFKKDDRISFRYTDIGKPYHQNDALALVHGTYSTNRYNPKYNKPRDYLDGDWGRSYIIFGRGASQTRDVNVYGATHRGMLEEEETYRERSYFVAGKLSHMDHRAPTWVKETYRDKPAAIAGQPVVLYKYKQSDNEFGGCLPLKESCGQRSAAVKRYGWTTPRKGHYALFYMKCGSKRYIGTDRYKFVPEDATGEGLVRPYICEGEAEGVQPTYQLLGYFKYGVWSVFDGAEYNQLLCNN